tara:strand:- start:217 stop:834 length:618 start_codon:yes stop_codon:yes gene_type:complete
MVFTQPNDIVWGTGCISPEEIGLPPLKVYSVRGPLTRKELINKGIKTPKIYGDPALLFPEIYNPKPNPKYKYGLIPHYIDFTDLKSLEVITRLESQGVKIINITAGVFNFIDELLQCSNILSSSLHGLIASDAYNIPNTRVKLSDKLAGGDFKFNDYSLSMGKTSTIGDINDYLHLDYSYNTQWDKNKILESGPWNDPKCKFFYE